MYIVTRDKNEECSSFSALQAGITIPLAKAKIGPPAIWKTFDVLLDNKPGFSLLWRVEYYSSVFCLFSDVKL